jgi:peptide deformylase
MIIRKDQLKLISENDPILNTPPTQYEFTGDDVFFANILFERMKELGGVGLSANQVGIAKTVFVMGLDTVRFDVFNPKILSVGEETINFGEGCLSFPGITLDVKRPITINVEYQNVRGEVIQQTLTGLTARVFQHEYDHMMGKTFKSHVSPMKWAMAVKKFKHKKEKIIKKHATRIAYDMLKDVQNNASEVSR